ncbi:MAG: hypothetical protein ACXW2I_17100 [Burkholderiales bacterium]
MNRRLIAMLVVLCMTGGAAMAAQSRITIEPSGPVYADDILTVTVETATPGADWARAVRPRSENMTLTLKRFNRPQPGMPATFVFNAAPQAAGKAWVEADIHGEGEETPRDHAPRVTVNVRPDLGRGFGDAAATFGAQRAANRPRLFARVTPSTYRAYPGQRIELTWWAQTPEQSITFAEFRPQIPGIELTTLARTPPIRTMAGGVIVSQTEIGHAVLTPKAPGTLHIPAYDVVAENDLGLEIVPLRRWTNAIDIEVLPLPPEAANLPIGKFAMQCKSEAPAYWPKVKVEVAGTGHLDAAAPPRLTKVLAVPVIIGSAAPGIWTYEVHSRDPELVTIPDLSFDFFNPETQRVEQGACDDIPILSRLQEELQPAAKAEGHARIEEVQIARSIAGFCALAGLFMMFSAMRR